MASAQKRAALGLTAAATIMMSAVATAPAAQAQAQATCNSTRLCLYWEDGTLSNISPDVAVPACSTGSVMILNTLDKAYNRSNRAFTVTIYNSDNTTTPISRLDPGETIDYTPSATYTMCRWGL